MTPRWPPFLCLLVAHVVSSATAAEDWPMWRYDAQRSAACPNQLPAELTLLWQREYAARKQAWDDPLNLDLMTYDRVFEPIVIDGRLLIGFNDADKLVALDADSGNELWTFYADGPVRLPPAGANGRIYFTSDDGYLYCVAAADGRLLWKFSGAPNSQHAIGNGRFTSAWPARGGPVVHDDVVYFAASIWPFMGTFVFALDGESGELVWVNDSVGSQYIKQPHSAPSFAGVAPQGALVATDADLIVPGGRSVPAVFDRANGKLRYFELNAGGKGTGGSFVAADQDHFYVHTRLKGTRAFSLEKGLKTAFMPNEPVLQGGQVYAAAENGKQRLVRAYEDEKLVWEIEADGSGDLILAGDQLIAAGPEQITFIRMANHARPAEIVKSIPVEQQVERLLVADQKLFAVTIDGRLLAFGSPQTDDNKTDDTRTAAVVANDQTNDTAKLLAAGDAEGYALWFGRCDSPQARSLALTSPFSQLAMIDPRAESIHPMRTFLDQRQRYGAVTVHQGDPVSFRAPEYVANMVFVDQAAEMTGMQIRRAYQSVRPYGGVLYLLAEHNHAELKSKLESLDLEQANIAIATNGLVVRRVGALPGSADWTHQYGDVANTIKSDDRRVKLPLGILWFGGSSNMDVLPRHGHGPTEQVVGGRLFIQGMNCLTARDVYTGRVLWKREFTDLGTFDVFYDKTYENVPLDPKYNQVHIPGANARGTNYVVTSDRVYLLEGNVCHALDPTTGETIADFRLPKSAAGEEPAWGYIGVYEDVLLGGLGFADYRGRHGLAFPSDKELKASRAGFGTKSLDRAASVALVGFDRHTGQQRWQVNANHSFWHNGIVAGGGKVYCLDRNPKRIEDALRRRGKSRPESYRIVAVDAQTGKQVWETKDNIFGTWLGYSERHDLLLQAGAQASDRLTDEVARGMTVYRGSDGSVQWSNDTLKYAGPCILHNDLIITNANSYSESAGAFFLKTGQQKMIEHAITGERQPWKVTRAYGCNNIIASENLLTFRSGAAGFYDLLADAGTGNLGGFKSGCTSNLVVANGVLNAPDYTRTCSCAYQNQTSLALVHMPDMETWSIYGDVYEAGEGEQIQQLAINFGAPGDRRDGAGVLWLEHPVVAGESPPLSLRFNSEARFFQHHASTMAGQDRPWMYASGAEGITELRLGLKLHDEQQPRTGIPIDHVSDDAEENENGEVNLSSSDLELVEDSSAQVVGVRFNNIPLARQTTIRNAYIQFSCDEASEGDTALIIAAEDVGNAMRFSDQSHDLTSRTRTAIEVGWQPAAWKKGASGADQRTPELKSLVQAIVDRPDWQPGHSLAFLFSGTGKRVAASSKAGKQKSPRLMIDADPAMPVATGPLSHYDVHLFFAAPSRFNGGRRVFDVIAQGQIVAENVTVDPSQPCVDLWLENVATTGDLQLQFVPKQGVPVLSGMHVTLQKRSD